MAENQKKMREIIGACWVRETKDNPPRKVLSMKLDPDKLDGSKQNHIVAFENRRKEKDHQPDFLIFDDNDNPRRKDNNNGENKNENSSSGGRRAF